MPNYTRPGVEAAAKLAKNLNDPELWARIESEYTDMMKTKGGLELQKLDEKCNTIGSTIRQRTEKYITVEELFTFVQWKFAKGKARPALWKHLKSNTEKDVKENSKIAFQKADAGEIRGSIEALAALKGVGPATASAVLSFYSDQFHFMDDEVIECLHQGKRTYTVPLYMSLNDQCGNIAKPLGSSWTARRVGRALWTAARIKATTGSDSVVTDQKRDSPTKQRNAQGETKRQRKR